MSTESLRKDHDLISKVLKAMEVTIELLQKNTTIPESILRPVIDFTKNFTDICHHGKEEESLFPALEKTGMPKNIGPIAVMLMEHEISRRLGTKMEESAAHYLDTGESQDLISYMQQYVEHVSEHLWKENNRLFMMAEMRLNNNSEQVRKSLQQIEEQKLSSIGENRRKYEEIAENLEKDVRNLI